MRKAELTYKVDAILKKMADNMPPWTIDYEAYIKGARITTEIAMKAVYYPLLTDFRKLKNGEDKALLQDISKPRELMNALNMPKPSILEYKKRKAWKAVHVSPNCQAYATKLIERVGKMAKKDPIACGEGKRPISAFAKAEMDLRHEEQEKKLEALVKHGYRLCWLSSHADCSPRCAPWQGKLVDIVHYSDLPSKRMPYKKDGNAVYSLKSIMEQEDRNGYRNNIISGFNCRHHLIPYASGSKPPKPTSEKERKIQYEIEQRLREMERNIRQAKRNSLLYNEIDKKRSQAFAKEAESLTREYKAYASENGYRWHNYRLEV